MMALILALLLSQPPDGGALPVMPVDREGAQAAMAAARSAVAQADASAESRASASAQLQLAEAAFAKGDLNGTVEAANSAWQLVSRDAREKIRFEVAVAEDGRTEVHSRTGPPVHVEAMGKTRVLYPGQQVQVEKGQPPGPSRIEAPAMQDPPPERPSTADAFLLSPRRGQVLVLKGSPKALGPVTLQWKAVPGVAKYEVSYKGAAGASVPFETTKTSFKLPKLPRGKYEWTVRAITDDGAMAVAGSHFELEPKAVKLEVKGTTWK